MKEMDDEFFIRGIESKARGELRISHIIVISHKQRLIDFYINLKDEYMPSNRMEVKMVVYIKVFVKIGRTTQLLFIARKQNTEERKEREREEEVMDGLWDHGDEKYIT